MALPDVAGFFMLSRCFALLCAAFAAVTVLSVPSTAVAQPTAAGAATTQAGPVAGQETEAGAMARARASGQPVEVLDLRSETKQVFANPEGTFTARFSLEPVRVRLPDGSWTPVDTTLRVEPDGSVTPGALPVEMAFSGGAKGPLARITRGGKSLAVSWPTALPKPALAGDTATYGDVLPGVDLRIHADVSGFAEQLVVKNSAAAANPALDTLRLTLDSPGLAVRATPVGGLAAVDAAGGTVFQAPAPSISDSDATGLGTGAHRARIGVRVAGSALELTSIQPMPATAGVRFPLLAAVGTWTYGNPAWTEVNFYDANSSTWRTVPTSLAVGFQNFQPPTLVRSFLRFGLDSRIFGTHILDATLNVFENWSSSCTARPFQVHVTGAFNGGTTWNNQPAWGAALATANTAHGHDAGCPSAGVDLDVTSGVATAARNRTVISFGLRATDEGDELAWKKFAVNPTLLVDYNRRPNTPAPTDLHTSVPASACATTTASAPHVSVSRLTGIRLFAKASDPDGDQVRVVFDFRPNNGTPIATPTVGDKASGSTFDAAVATTVALTTGVVYAWRVTVQDVRNGHVVDQSVPSAWCFIVQDNTRPSPPSITSTDYPSDAYAGFTGDSGEFTFAPSATRDTDIVSYSYGLDQPTPLSTVAARADGTAVVSITPPSYGPHDLFVLAKDSATNPSSTIPYHFYVGSPNDAIANWKFDEGSGTTSTAVVENDPGATGPTATLSPTGVSWLASGKSGSALHFDGTSGWVGTGTTVPMNHDFSISAWVRLTSKANSAYVFSQGFDQGGGLSVEYFANTDQWCVHVQPPTGSDLQSVSPIGQNSACSGAVPQVNVWTYIDVGFSFSGTSSGVGISVNGGAGAGALVSSPLQPGGNLEIGRARTIFGTSLGFLPGDVDDVRIFDRLLRSAEITDLMGYASTATQAGAWSFNETSGLTAADSSGKGHPATLTGGAVFGPGGHAGGQLTLNGTAAVATTGAGVLRTDQSFVVSAWVRLSNVDGEYTVASVDGDNTAGFELMFEPDDGGTWTFGLPPGDLKGAESEKPAQVTAIDSVGAWVHVTGAYNGFTHVVQVRVTDSFGTRVGYGRQDLPWNAGGSLQIGRAKMLGDADDAVYGDYLPGSVDELKAYTGAMIEADLRTLDNS
jgi:hypothetical protein